jgi:hypothetical protein
MKNKKKEVDCILSIRITPNVTNRRNEKLLRILALSAFHALRVAQTLIWLFCDNTLHIYVNHESV